jgi:hypothetical protein
MHFVDALLLLPAARCFAFCSHLNVTCGTYGPNVNRRSASRQPLRSGMLQVQLFFVAYA